MSRYAFVGVPVRAFVRASDRTAVRAFVRAPDRAAVRPDVGPFVRAPVRAFVRASDRTVLRSFLVLRRSTTRFLKKKRAFFVLLAKSAFSGFF